ncbi:MAG: formate/nitrite transporter family protein [Planctomycetes bacterium]|nr:formate/nitrite transporter family protein [Planctomycetota bacterium]
MASFLTPPQIVQKIDEGGVAKARLSPGRTFLLALLAGAFIGFAAHLATVVGTGPYAWWGLKKFMVGSVFSVGLMLVIIPGSELWTGNCLMAMAYFEKKISLSELLKNWVIVLAGNFIGAVSLALLIVSFAQLLNGPVGGTAIQIAYDKVAQPEEGLSHWFAFFSRGVCCNILVCLAIMMAAAAKDIAGKIWAIYFPIMAFVASGFEHSIANMYFLPAGYFAKYFGEAVKHSGKGADSLDLLNWSAFFNDNLIPVTLGNFVGGFLIVGWTYWFLYGKVHSPSLEEE